MSQAGKRSISDVLAAFEKTTENDLNSQNFNNWEKFILYLFKFNYQFNEFKELPRLDRALIVSPEEKKKKCKKQFADSKNDGKIRNLDGNSTFRVDPGFGLFITVKNVENMQDHQFKELITDSNAVYLLNFNEGHLNELFDLRKTDDFKKFHLVHYKTK